MIYECLIDKRYKKFLIAKPKGWAWTVADQEWPLEVGLSEDVELGIIDRPVRISWSKGVLTVLASDMSGSIVNEEALKRNLHLDELTRRKYPVNLHTIYQPVAATAAMLGDN